MAKRPSIYLSAWNAAVMAIGVAVFCATIGSVWVIDYLSARSEQAFELNHDVGATHDDLRIINSLIRDVVASVDSWVQDGKIPAGDDDFAGTNAQIQKRLKSLDGRTNLISTSQLHSHYSELLNAAIGALSESDHAAAARSAEQMHTAYNALDKEIRQLHLAINAKQISPDSGWLFKNVPNVMYSVAILELCLVGAFLLFSRWQSRTILYHIEERDRAARALSRSETRLSTYLGMAADAVWECDTNGQLTSFSAGNIMHRDLLRQGVEPLLAKVAANMPVSGEATRLSNAWQRRTPFRSKIFSVTRENSPPVWLSISGDPQFEGGALSGYHGVIRDISQAIREREDLAQKHLALVQIVENSSEIFYRWDLEDGTLVKSYASPGMTRLVGYTPEELTGGLIKAAQFIHPDDREGWRRTVREGLSTGKPWEIETRIIHRDGSVRWVLERSYIRREGAKLIAEGFVADITNLKTLARDKAMLAEAVSQLDHGVFVVDTAKPDAPLIFVNDAFARITGYSREEMLGRNPRFLKGLDADPAAVERVNQDIAAGKSINLELLSHRKDGTVFWNEVSLSPVHEQGNRTSLYLGIVRDVTARREAAAELARAKEAAEEASRAKTAFIAMMSHEIRTPMNGVIGMASLLVEEPLAPSALQAAKTIRDSAQSLMRMLNDILDLSKLEAGKLGLENKPFALRVLLSETVQWMWPQASTRGLQLHLEASDDLPAALVGDEGRLRQILLNLLGNAIKFTEAGHVTLSVAPAQSDPSRLRFSVRDTGIGIPADRMQYMFKDFSQADQTIARRFGGTGLGLSICRRLVHQMGGQIGVESEEGKGSNFWFELALPEAKWADIAAESEAPFSNTIAMLQGRALRGLMAEDNPTNRLVAQRVAASAGIELDTVDDGAQAVAALSKCHYDFVLMDSHMPVMDGIAATKAIRALPGRIATIPIIGVTANAYKEAAEACYEAGMNDIVHKPFTKNILLAAIASATGITPRTEARIEDGETAADPFTFISDQFGADAVKPLVSIFVQDAQLRLADMRRAFEQDEPDLTRIRDHAHTLKSSAGQLGLFNTARVAADCESAAVLGLSDDARHALAIMESDFGVFCIMADERERGDGARAAS
jgi:PAS domain S-box-containing protein